MASADTPALLTAKSTDEHVEEKKGCDAIRNVDQENAFPSKNIAGGDVIDVVIEEGSANGEVAESKLEKKTGDEKIHVPTVLEPSKALGSDDPLDDCVKEAESSDQTPILSSVPEKAVEVPEKEKENSPQASHVPQPSGEAVLEKPTEHAEISVTSESELKAEKDPDDSEYKMEEVNKPKEYSETSVVLGSAPEGEIQSKDQSGLPDVPKQVPEMEEKQEKSTSSVAKELEFGVNGEVEKIETLEAKGTEMDGVSKDEKSLIEPASSKDEPSGAEKENLLDDPNKIEKGDGNTDVVKVASKEATVGVGLPSHSSTQISENMLKVEDKVKEEKEEQNIKTNESALAGATIGLNSADEVTKDSFEGDKVSRDVEIVTEKKEIEVEKGVMPTSVETAEARDVERAYSNKTTENQTVEPIETTIDKLEKAEEENEAALKSEGANLVAPSSDHGDRETTKEVTKHEVPAKPTHNSPPNSIMLKVKKLIGKLKKAIKGKSPSSKTTLSDGKDEIKVK